MPDPWTDPRGTLALLLVEWREMAGRTVAEQAEVLRRIPGLAYVDETLLALWEGGIIGAPAAVFLAALAKVGQVGLVPLLWLVQAP